MTSPPHLSLAAHLATQMLTEAQNGGDLEICGLISSHNGKASSVYSIENIAENPQRRYLMEPRQQIAAFKTMRQRNETLFGIYHSHPAGPSHPSNTDIIEANYSDIAYFIISTDTKGLLKLGAFKINTDHFKEFTLTIA